ncbi:MAG: amidohydrolase [Phycisphaerales bacterium]|nr:amidohydrolase [Phycisphaerales bacterium]
MPLPQLVEDTIESLLPDLMEFRHDIHAHPELGYEEHRTRDQICTALDAAGIEHKTGFAGGTGTIAHLPGAADTAIALRADIDALPIEECTGLPWASRHPGKMHACGHDGHTTILLGTARVLKRLSEEAALPNPVTFVFQPAEEGGGGGEKMCQDGCLDGSVFAPRARAMFGLHGWPSLPLGVVSSSPGPMLAAADHFTLTIKGLGGHAAMPQTTRDPIAAAAAIIQSLQHVVSRRVDPVMGGVISVTSVHSGTTFNIIPGEVVMQGTVRALFTEAQEILREGLAQTTDLLAKAHGCTAELDYQVGYPVTSNDPDATAQYQAIANDLIGPEKAPPFELPCMGAEDFSYYGQHVPACFFALGLIPDGQEAMPSVHHPKFDFTDQALPIGIRMFCGLALQACPD